MDLYELQLSIGEEVASDDNMSSICPSDMHMQMVGVKMIVSKYVAGNRLLRGKHNDFGLDIMVTSG